MKQSRYRDLHFLQTVEVETGRQGCSCLAVVEDVNPALGEAE